VNISCSKKIVNSHRKGFIIYNDIKYLFFVPVKKFDKTDCYENLRTENLSVGLQFNTGSFEYLELIKKSAIPYKDNMADQSYAEHLQTIKILPVEFDYKVVEVLDSAKTVFEFSIHEKDVKFYSDHEKLNIFYLKPIKCERQ
jgi:hypothetical protein